MTVKSLRFLQFYTKQHIFTSAGWSDSADKPASNNQYDPVSRRAGASVFLISCEWAWFVKEQVGSQRPQVDGTW